MKIIYKKIMPYILSLQILTLSLFSCPITVYASSTIPDDYVARDIIAAVELSIEKKDFKYFTNFLYDSADGLIYLLSQMGAVVTLDFPKWVNNNKALETLVEITPAKKEGDNIVFTKELFTELKVILDDYIAENQPFILVPTWKANEVPASVFGNKTAYQVFRDYASSHWITAFNKYYSYNSKLYELCLGDVTPIIQDGGGFIIRDLLYKTCYSLNGNWAQEMAKYSSYRYLADASELTPSSNGVYLAYMYYNENEQSFSSTRCGYLVTPDGGRMRVFKKQADFMNYSVGQRKIYYTSEYYNYVPEDLQVSIDDLQNTIDDMQDVIDKLLDQITNNTSESEIEELLRLILEELKNNQGGGDGSGGGDVNVDIDLSTTNGILSKILAKVTQISEKISASAGQSMTDVVNSIEKLGDMLKKYLDRITGDLGDIKDQLEQMTEAEFEEKADSFLNETAGSFSEIGEVAKGKFPFSIPNDMRTLLELLSVPPPAPETAALYSAGSAGIQPLSGDHGGDGATRPPTDGTGSGDHGGGGNTRPPTGGIASVEQGSGGGSFGISESGAPVIRCPIVIKRLGIDYSVKIDLSDFDKVAALSRAFLTLLFIYGLYNLTFKVIGLWGDLAE